MRRKIGFLPAVALLAATAVLFFLGSCSAKRASEKELAAYAEAKILYSQGRLVEAEEALSVFSKSTSLPQARFLLGKTKFFRGDFEGASLVFNGLVRKFPEYREARIWLARALLEQGKKDEAERMTDTLLAEDAGDMRVYYLAGMIKAAKGDVRGSLGYLERSAELGDELAKTYFELARIYYQFGQDEKAEERLKRARSVLQPGNPMLEGIEELLRRFESGGNQ